MTEPTANRVAERQAAACPRPIGRSGRPASAAGRSWHGRAFLVVEVIGGLLTNSLALLADAGHMFTDAAGIGLALLAIWFARRAATAEKSFGYYRVEIFAAVANAVILFGSRPTSCTRRSSASLRRRR